MENWVEMKRKNATIAFVIIGYVLTINIKPSINDTILKDIEKNSQVKASQFLEFFLRHII